MQVVKCDCFLNSSIFLGHKISVLIIIQGWTFKIVFQGLVGRTMSFFSKEERGTTSILTFVSISCSVSFVLLLEAKKLYIDIIRERNPQKVQWIVKDFSRFTRKSFFCLTSPFSHNKEKKSIISFIVCLKPRFMHEYDILMNSYINIIL